MSLKEAKHVVNSFATIADFFEKKGGKKETKSSHYLCSNVPGTVHTHAPVKNNRLSSLLYDKLLLYTLHTQSLSS